MSCGTRALLLLLAVLSSGCALPPSRIGAPVTEGADRQQVLNKLRSQARLLRYNGRYIEAIRQLDQAIALQPDDTALRDERTQTQLSWSRLQLELLDRSALIQATARAERLPLLERLVLADPALQPDLQALTQTLQQDAEALADCGRRQSNAQPQLARRCLRLSLRLDDSEETRKLLAGLKKKPVSTDPSHGKAAKVVAPETTAAVEETDEPASPELIKAQQLMRDGKHFGAIRQLRKLQESGRGTPASQALLLEAERALSDNTHVLLEAGDRLYHQGRVKEALALWDAALVVDPYNQAAREKSERAARVLSNLEALGGGANP
jgi:tetratricopeptide (TPR) repeat protein